MATSALRTSRLWHDLESAIAIERANARARRSADHVRHRLVLACVAVVLFIGLLGAIALRVASP